MKFKVEADIKTMASAKKEEIISDFNEAVKKKASKPFLQSLYEQTLFDLSEANKLLGYLPQDGIARLDMSWNT